jgi:hypothetical protein
MALRVEKVRVWHLDCAKAMRQRRTGWRAIHSWMAYAELFSRVSASSDYGAAVDGFRKSERLFVSSSNGETFIKKQGGLESWREKLDRKAEGLSESIRGIIYRKDVCLVFWEAAHARLNQ